ncbi:MAG: transglycosylase SLT domain-containing protein [Wenzhouxiangella sp.]
MSTPKAKPTFKPENVLHDAAQAPGWASVPCHWVGALLAALLVLWLPAAAVAADDQRAQQRETFKAGWAAVARGDQAAAMEALVTLGDYPLAPYLEFELIRQRIDTAPEPVVEQFLARHRDWSFANQLELNWLRSLARRGQADALLRHGRQSSDAEVRCHVARADLAAGRTDGLEQRAAELWLVGRSQHRACDPLFAWWRRNGNPGTDQGWRRFHLALNQGEVNLARYLRRYLDSDQRQWADHWLAMQANPKQTLRRARQWDDHEQARLIMLTGLKRVARSEWDQAEELWSLLQGRFSWSDADRQAIAREIALYRAVALEIGAADAIAALPASARDQQMLEWQLRAALAHRQWPLVLDAVADMSLDEQARGRWRYWRARALAEQQRPEAALVFATLATEANYYGFLAAARLGQPFNVCSQDLPADAAIQRRLKRDAEFERAVELHHVGLNHHARVTWASLSRRLSRDDLRQAALLAAGEGWYDRAINALGNTGDMRAYAWRFPMVERARVQQASERWQVDPALVYGLMRAESAMQPDAMSPVGARGLLQLMPTTAEAVARRNGLPFNGQGDLMRPDINIPLGVAHLAELERRYAGDWIHVAAAYNAGANAVARWLDSRPKHDRDIWLETLPFFETRDYVPRVLAFATLYEYQLQRNPEVLVTHVLGDDRPRHTGFACAL